MIHTRKTIFKTLLKRIRELTKHANPAPKEFKKILLAVILNDLKEWAEYIPKDDPSVIDNTLLELLRDNCFIIERISDPSHTTYVNVNTPQTNTTWQRIWDRQSSETKHPEKKTPVCKPWLPDPNCEVKLIYFVSVDKDGEPISNESYLKNVYGEYGENLKTICDKMNIYIDRETGIAWYLNNVTCEWERVGSKLEGVTPDQVEEIISEYNINRVWENTESGPLIRFTLVKNGEENTLDLLTKEEVEEMV